MKISSIPKRGQKGSVVYLETRHGKVARQYVRPANPRTAVQQAHRNSVRAVSARWRTLALEQQAAWRVAAAENDFTNEAGDPVRLNGQNLFVSLNTRRADLGLAQFELPPAKPGFPRNPVVELAITNTGDEFTMKVRLESSPAQYTLVQGAKPVGTAVRCVQHYPFLGLLPPPVDGWSDITELYVARYGVPKAGTAIWIRTCQHIDGWTDVPNVLRARVPAPPAERPAPSRADNLAAPTPDPPRSTSSPGPEVLRGGSGVCPVRLPWGYCPISGNGPVGRRGDQARRWSSSLHP